MLGGRTRVSAEAPVLPLFYGGERREGRVTCCCFLRLPDDGLTTAGIQEEHPLGLWPWETAPSDHKEGREKEEGLYKHKDSSY